MNKCYSQCIGSEMNTAIPYNNVIVGMNETVSKRDMGFRRGRNKVRINR